MPVSPAVHSLCFVIVVENVISQFSASATLFATMLGSLPLKTQVQYASLFLRLPLTVVIYYNKRKVTLLHSYSQNRACSAVVAVLSFLHSVV